MHSSLLQFQPTGLFKGIEKVDSLWTVRELFRSGLANEPAKDELSLYVRGESIELWAALNNALTTSNTQKNNFWLQGPPGVGKSTELYGWMMFTAQTQHKSAIWFHLRGSGNIYVVMFQNGIWSSGILNKRDTCTAFLESMNYKFGIVIFDAIREGMKELLCSAIDKEHKLVIACTSYGETHVGSASQFDFNLQKPYTLYSWEKEDYVAAIKRGIKITDVNDATEEYLDENHDLTTKCKELLDYKHQYGGLSFRLMQQPLGILINALMCWQESIENKSVLLKGLQGYRTSATVHSLMGLRRGFRGSCVVCEFVMKQLSDDVDLSFVTAAKAVMPDNPSWQGWVFELEVLIKFRKNPVIRLSNDLNDLMEFTIESTIKYSKEVGIKTFQDNTVYIPDLWCNPCFDLVHIRKGVKNDKPHYFVTFFNATKASSHEFNFEYLATFLQPVLPLPNERKHKRTDLDIAFVVIVPSMDHICENIGSNEVFVQNFDEKFIGVTMTGVIVENA